MRAVQSVLVALAVVAWRPHPHSLEQLMAYTAELASSFLELFVYFSMVGYCSQSLKE